MSQTYRNHKTFGNRAKAEKLVEKLQKEFPKRTFQIRERKFFQKHKTRFTVRSTD